VEKNPFLGVKIGFNFSKKKEPFPKILKVLDLFVLGSFRVEDLWFPEGFLFSSKRDKKVSFSTVYFWGSSNG